MGLNFYPHIRFISAFGTYTCAFHLFGVRGMGTGFLILLFRLNPPARDLHFSLVSAVRTLTHLLKNFFIHFFHPL